MISPRWNARFATARISCLLLLISSFVAIPLASPGLAQDPVPKASKSESKEGLIFGTVWGPDDRPVYGVKVKIRPASKKKAKWELFSDHHGEFAQRVPAGRTETDYVVWADLKNFKTADKQPLHLVKEVTVQIYSDERVDVGLHLSR